MFKIDLHTHSEASPDGGITANQYARILEQEKLDYIAITDHDRIDFALGMQKALGDKIIVGQEITTTDGELIGLYLKERIKPHQTAFKTAQAIHAQGGLVYVPHPFETTRKGLQEVVLQKIADLVDIVEVHNGRALGQSCNIRAATWAKLHGKTGASSSDAHGVRGLGYSYSIVQEIPSRGSLVGNIKMSALASRKAPLYSFLYPTLHRTRKRIGLGRS